MQHSLALLMLSGTAVVGWGDVAGMPREVARGRGCHGGVSVPARGLRAGSRKLPPSGSHVSPRTSELRRRVRFSGCTRSFGAGVGCGSMAGRRKRRGMVQPTAIMSLEDGGRVGGDLKGARGHSWTRVRHGAFCAWLGPLAIPRIDNNVSVEQTYHRTYLGL